MYNKLFTKILDSSIWLESAPTRIVWLTFIACMDQDGFVQFASTANVAHRARVTPEEAGEAIRCLESPDPDSSDPEHEGRRIERVPGGWVVLNAEKHRAMVTRAIIQEQTRERVRRYRQKRNGNARVTHGRKCNATVTPSEADAEVQARGKTERGARFAFKGHALALTPGQHEVLVRMLNGVDLDLLGEVYPRWDKTLAASGEPFDALEWCTRMLKREVGIEPPSVPTDADRREAEAAFRRLLSQCHHQPTCPDRESCLAKLAVKAMLRRTKPLAVRA